MGLPDHDRFHRFSHFVNSCYVGPLWVLVPLLGVPAGYPKINPCIENSANAAVAVVGPLIRDWTEVSTDAVSGTFGRVRWALWKARAVLLEMLHQRASRRLVLWVGCAQTGERSTTLDRQESETHGHRRVKNAARASLNLILSYLCPHEERMLKNALTGNHCSLLLDRFLVNPVFSHSLILALVFSLYGPG